MLIYETISGRVEDFFGVDSLEVMASSDLDWERGEFLLGTPEDQEGNFRPLPKEIGWKKRLVRLLDTTDTLYAEGRWREYTMEELVALLNL